MSATHAVFNVPDVSCNHCKIAIENAVGALGGVNEVAVDVERKSVSVRFEADDVSLETIEAAMDEVGYGVAGHHVFG